MKQNIQLSSKLSLPADIAGRRTAIFGLSGSGKSNTATVIVEGLLTAGEQVIMVDPKGEGWGLLSLANGKPSNLDVLVFGPNGHVTELQETHGPMLADFVVDTGRSIVLSLLGLPSFAAERRFVTAFLSQLYKRKSKAEDRSRTLVVFDEARLFVPENAKGDQAEMSGAVQRIARLGRSFGLGSLFIDQRPQQVAKSVISQVETIICHQLSHKTDRAALSDWVAGYDTDGHGAEFLGSLASLQPGEAWVWSPAWLQLFQRTKVDRRRTYDSGAAPSGATRTKVHRADVDIEQLRGQLAEIVVKAKENDPAELKRQIAELRKQIKQPLTPVTDARAIKTAVDLVTEEFAVVLKNRDALIADIHTNITLIGEAVQRALTAIPRVLSTASPVRTLLAANPQYQQPALQTLKPTGTETKRISSAKPNSISLGRCERAILQVLSQFVDGCEKGKLTLLAGYSYSGSFQNALGALRTFGLITGSNSGVLQITDAGRACGPFEPLPTGEALVEYWLNHQRFGKCERAILRVLVDNPDGLTKEELCSLTEYNYSGSFQNALGTLRTTGLIVGRNSERMTAAQSLLDAKE